jgi:hypothetical protein
MMRLVATGTAVTALLFSGVVHGLWTGRWAGAEDLDAALAQLQTVPLTVGDWRGQDVKQTKARGAEAIVSLSRRYVHRGTGQAVTVLLACGRPGPVSIHTPDVCYAASGFEVEPPTRREVSAGDGQAADFLTARLSKTKATEQTFLRIYWSWHADGGWQVPDNPRLAFSSQRRLYKLYVIREMARANEPLEGDPCAAFLSVLLPELKRGLFNPS